MTALPAKERDVKVSLVTAVNNRAATIGEALESVRAQRGLTIEHLVIDGGSTDGTLQEVERRWHPGMQVISEPDAGVHDALDKGIGPGASSGI
jgi:glycosyltransferase involved in cell wall biosynthesis